MRKRTSAHRGGVANEADSARPCAEDDAGGGLCHNSKGQLAGALSASPVEQLQELRTEHWQRRERRSFVISFERSK